MSESAVVVGIDVAKEHVDVDALGVKFAATQFGNDAEAHTALIAVLAPFVAARS